MATKNIKINFSGLDYDSSSTFSITSNAGDGPITLSYSQLTSTGTGYDFNISDTATQVTVTSSNGTCNNTEASASFAAAVTSPPITDTPTPTPTVTSAPSTDTPTPTPTVTAEPGIDWQSFTGTDIVLTLEEACAAPENTTYYTIGTPGPTKQLYSSQSESATITTTGYLVTGTTQYNVPNGVLGSAGSCPTSYNHTIYISAPGANGDLCSQDYTINSLKNFFTENQSFSLSELLNKQIFDGQSPWTPPAGTTQFYAVDKTNTRTTRDFSQFTVIEVNASGVVESTLTETCSASEPTVDPGDPQTPTPTPIPGDGTTPVPDKPDTPQEQ